MNHPRVSVVIPLYQGEQWIRETLTTVAQQTRPPDECIVVDDGSTDLGPEMVKTFVDRLGPSLRLVRTENRGVGAARNVGLDLATGEYVALLDADDLWNERKLELQVELLHRTGAVLCLTAYEVFDAASLRSLGVIRCRDAARSVRRWLAVEGNGLLVSSTGVVRRSVLERIRAFNPDIATGEDIEFTMRLLQEGEVVSVPDVLVGYRAHPAQAHRSLTDIAENTVRLHDLMLAAEPDAGFAARCRANLEAHVGYHHLLSGRPGLALERFRRVLGLDPVRLVTLPLHAVARRWGRKVRIRRRRYFDAPRDRRRPV